MKTIGKLEQLLMEGKITEEEYRERKAVYVEAILELYCLGILSKEQMQDELVVDKQPEVCIECCHHFKAGARKNDHRSQGSQL